MESWPSMHRALSSVPQTAKEVFTAKSCQSPHFPGEKKKKKLDAESAGYLSVMVHLQGYQDAWDSPGRHTFGCVCEGVSRKEAEMRRPALNMDGNTPESWGSGLNGNEKGS